MRGRGSPDPARCAPDTPDGGAARDFGFESKKRSADRRAQWHCRRMTKIMETRIGAPIEMPKGDPIAAALDRDGWAMLPGLLSGPECDGTAALYARDAGFRSHVFMARHGFGRGEYRYFAYPLPPLVQALRGMLYARLAPIANRWHERMGMAARFPADPSVPSRWAGRSAPISRHRNSTCPSTMRRSPPPTA